MIRIKVTAEYPRPWWRRLLGLPAKRAYLGTHAVEPWPWNYVSQGPSDGRMYSPESGE